MKQLKFNLWQEIKDYVFITFGLLSYAIGFTLFLLPYEITTGGVAGISSLIFFGTGIKVQYSYLFINTVLLIAAIKILGFKFCIKTIYAIVMLTVLLAGFQELIADSQGNLPHIIGNQAFMATIIGGALEGLGLATVFLNNGSTGGTDIIAAIVNKYKDITIGRILMICDIIIVCSSYVLFHSWEKVVFGFVTLITANIVLDYVMNSTRQSVQFFIFSNKHEEIAEAISNVLSRGVTVLYGEGWYSKEEKKVLVVLAKRRESVAIFRLINQIDPKAFVSQSNVVGVYGEGFDPIKVK